MEWNVVSQDRMALGTVVGLLPCWLVLPGAKGQRAAVRLLAVATVAAGGCRMHTHKRAAQP